MGWLICGKANLVEETAIIQDKEALKKDQELLLEEKKLLEALKKDQELLLEETKRFKEQQEEHNKKICEFEIKRSNFFREQQLLTTNLEIRSDEHQQILRLFQKEVSDFQEVFKEFIEIKNKHMKIIDLEPDPKTFETLKELYFKFKEKEENLYGPRFYINGIEIDKKNVPSGGEGVIMTNYLSSMEEVLSQ
tara:strand:- start:770 stop:1345 length:576 start_codon:yes stop_codon:yes gene_type:complete